MKLIAKNDNFQIYKHKKAKLKINLNIEFLTKLYLEVLELLGIRPHSPKLEVYVMPNNTYFKRYKKSQGYYDEKERKLYVSAETVDRYIMGHELGHMIICQYFINHMSKKLQEVICGYVEYKLRKVK